MKQVSKSLGSMLVGEYRVMGLCVLSMIIQWEQVGVVGISYIVPSLLYLP